MSEGSTRADRELERAWALCDLKRWAEAEQLLRSVVADDPQNPRALCLLAQALLMQGTDTESLRLARAAIMNAPHEEWGFRLASIALTRLGLHDESVAMARAAVREAPDEPAALSALARALVARGGELSEARTVANQAVGLAPDRLESHLVVGVVAAAEGRRTDAVDAFHRCLSINPEHSGTHNELARLQLKGSRAFNADRLAQAAGGFATAVRTDPRANVSRQNLDLVLHVFLARATYGICLAAYIASKTGDADSGAVLRVIPAFILFGPLIYAARFIARLRPSLRSYLWQMLRGRTVAIALLCDATAVIAIAAGALFAPARAVAFSVAVVAALVARIVLWSHRHRLFPRSGRHKFRTGYLMFLAAALFTGTAIGILLAAGPNADVAAGLTIVAITAPLGLSAAVLVYRRRNVL